MKYPQNIELLKLARTGWERLGEFRRRRRLSKDYSYGRQWQREVTLPDGRRVSEEERMEAEGQPVLTNNLIRQLLKTVIGKWRYLQALETAGADDAPGLQGALRRTTPLDTLDARALEEFLISGCVAQRVDPSGRVDNISPERILFSPFLREDASDARFLGMLHDLSLPEICRRFSGGDRERLEQISRLFTRWHGHNGIPFSQAGTIDFERSGSSDTMRVIEVWRRAPRELIRLHDAETADYISVGAAPELHRRLSSINRRRSAEGRPEIDVFDDIADVWEHLWLTPDGTVLSSDTLPESEHPNLVIGCYPMIDGEIHSLVEDVLSQQRYINRLVVMLDEVLRYSAKGVLLYPSDQLPAGMDWKTLRRLWSAPGSIIPFVRNSKNVMPHQINNAGTLTGGSEMLRTQLELFSRISGTSFSTDGAGMNANSADMLRRQMENEMISLLDLLSAFRGFILRRDELRRPSGKEVDGNA